MLGLGGRFLPESQYKTSFAFARPILPKTMKPAPKKEVMVLHPAAFNVKNMVGTRRMPQIAGSNRMATYGTPGST